MTTTRSRPLTEAELVALQRQSISNRATLSGRCGCFHCLSTFPAGRVTEFVDGDRTALCPVCGIDAVLSSAHTPIDEDLLADMHRRWFGTDHDESRESA